MARSPRWPYRQAFGRRAGRTRGGCPRHRPPKPRPPSPALLDADQKAGYARIFTAIRESR
jgi:hypothetical protein